MGAASERAKRGAPRPRTNPASAMSRRPAFIVGLKRRHPLRRRRKRRLGAVGGPLRLRLLGVGAMNSPCYAPAGLLVARGPIRVMIDGGPATAPRGRLDAWLVTDERAELAVAIRRLARV